MGDKICPDLSKNLPAADRSPSCFQQIVDPRLHGLAVYEQLHLKMVVILSEHL
jgi:hypothetical protein